MDWDRGGGFVNDSMVDNEPHQTTGTVSVSAEDKSKSTVACSVSQISKLTRPNEGLVLHGKKVYQVSLVALVHEIVDMTSQKIHLLLDDYTSGGPLEMTHILTDVGGPDEGNDFYPNQGSNNLEGKTRPLTDLKQGDYVRCFGVVKFGGDRSNLAAYNLRIVDDPNDITMHILEVIRDSMFYERSASGGDVNLNKGSVAMQVDSKQNSMYPQAGDFGKLSTRDKHLLKFLKDKGGEAGLRESDIQANFKAFSLTDIKESLEVLCAEGLAWQGDQEDLWCVSKDL